MINYFALTITEMGIGKIELAVIGAVILIFPVVTLTVFVFGIIRIDVQNFNNNRDSEEE